jgi:signal transduction histidine kinase
MYISEKSTVWTPHVTDTRLKDTELRTTAGDETHGLRRKLRLARGRAAALAREAAALRAQLAATQSAAAGERVAELARVNESLRTTVDGLGGTAGSGFLRQVLSEAMRQIGSENGGVFVYDSATDTLRLDAAIFDGERPEGAPVSADGRMAASDSRSWERLLVERRPVVVDLEREPESWPGATAWHRRRGTRVLVEAPLLLGDRPIGYLGLAVRRGPDQISQTQLEMVKALAQQATLALHIMGLANRAKEAAIAREQEQAAEERATELVKANAILSSTLDRLAGDAELDGFLGHVLLEITRIARAHSGHLFLHDAATSTLRLHTAVQDEKVVRGPLPDDPDLFRAPIAPDVSSNYLTALQRWTWLPVDDWKECRWTRTVDWHERMGHKAKAALSLLAGRRREGLVGLEFRDSTPLSATQVELIQALGSQAALALEMRRLGETERRAAVADERNRLAREIHDGLAQALALMVMQLAAAEDKLGPAWVIARKPLDTVRELAISALASARRSVGMLRPNASTGFLPAMRHVADIVGRYDTGPIDVRVTGTPFTFDATVEAELIGIAREAMTNAAKHSRGTRLALELTFTDTHAVRVAVVDDGVGFDPDEQRADAYGLVGMRERAARIGAALTLVTEPGGGTQVVAAWPG